MGKKGIMSKYLFTKVGHHMSKLSSRDEAVALLVEDFEGLTNLFLTLGVLHFPCHHGQKFGKIDCAVPVCVYLLYHFSQFGLSWVLSKGSS